ncbi:AAA family ATPase, partial [Bacillus cereus]|uniref:AAA family ATPase n=1 Tax=Bacillus cereus TaxID=1396 RepID=UPI003012F8D3
MFQVTEAQREKMKAVIGFIGCSGSGKTAGALLTAYGMMHEAYPDIPEEEVWKKIGVIDTEHNRAKLHVGLVYEGTKIGSFLHIDFLPPYTTERYNAAVGVMKSTGAEVIIIDSLSHNWQGEGGIVETHGGMSGNSFQNWGKLAPETTKLIKTLTQNDVHILTTLRTKTEYVVEQDANGRMAPRKVGTKPVQKDELEYEFMLNFVIDIEHVATTSKDNTQMFEGHPQ